MSNAPLDYLKWYYESNVWKRLHYRGVRTLKLPLDLWNYQELMFENDIHWVLETGTRCGRNSARGRWKRSRPILPRTPGNLSPTSSANQNSAAPSRFAAITKSVRI